MEGQVNKTNDIQEKGFSQKWFKYYKFLRYSQELGVMWCEYCSKYNLSTKWNINQKYFDKKKKNLRVELKDLNVMVSLLRHCQISIDEQLKDILTLILLCES